MNKYKIVIVGGGTAGWLTAAFLSSQLPLSLGKAVEITLVEASDIPTIGVGEATIPSMRQTLAACGIDEAEFLRECDATFKLGIEFAQWRQSPQQNPNESYFHPFGEPIRVGNHNPARQWSRLAVDKRGEFADLFSVQKEFAHAGQAPKSLQDRAFDGALSYAYHLDAGKFAEFLKTRFRKKGIRHLIAKVQDVKIAENGFIESLTLDNDQELSADLFIDCTGFASRLINARSDNQFISKSHQLFVDSAVTTRVPHKGVEDINGFTRSTAQESGWIWDIALHTRRGVGHVYSSKYIDDEAAKAQLAAYLKVDAGSLETRKLNMKIGYHEQQWKGNCIAVGLSSGFLEPLESTGIYLTEMANWALVELLPRVISGVDVRPRYNEIMSNHYENIVDFLKLHYCISGRRDSQFWIDNVDHKSIPATLADKLEAWQDNIPSVYDFDRTTQCFSVTNYQFVLFGMGWPSHIQPDSDENGQITSMLAALGERRERLKQFVQRDTMNNETVFKALGIK